MQARSAPPAAEDIEAVLSRFQAWAGSRASATTGDGVREISYDEALESGRGLRKRPEERPAPGAEESRQRPEPVAPAVAPAAGAPSARVPANPARKRAMGETRASSAGTPGTAPAAARVGNGPRRQPFRAALAQSISRGAPGSTLARSRGGEDRQVTLSMRVGASEQALIRIRAEEAGISVSAYLRQCALDVEILRAQVQQFMAASARSRLAEFSQPSPPSLPAIPIKSEGWFARWQRRIWGSRNTQLSLKA